MNPNPQSHVDEPTLERYALARLPSEDLYAVEEHLLMCAKCQELLAKVEEYIDVAKVALKQRDSSSTPKVPNPDSDKAQES